MYSSKKPRLERILLLCAKPKKHEADCNYILTSNNKCCRFSQDSDRERLKEEIRKEIEAEQERERLEKELREEILREEKAKEEKLLRKAAEIENKRVAEKLKKEKSDKELYNSFRKTGWSISASVGPNFPTGKFAKRTGTDGDYAKTGVYFKLDNNWHFGKVVGVTLGVIYDDNKFDNEAFEQNALDLGLARDTYSESKAYQNLSITIGPNIRAMGGKVSYEFNPFLSFTVHEMADYTIRIYDVNPQAEIRMVGDSDVRFGFGANNTLGVHIGKRVDMLFGLSFMYVNVQSPFTVNATGQDTVTGIEKNEVIRLSPFFGLKFSL